jgi:hypothetical protein
MRNVRRLLDTYSKLNEKNQFAVLVFARFKVIRQIAREVKPYVQERRICMLKQRPRCVHWLGLGG